MTSMARFFGRFEHTLDPKGRVILPSKFRPAFEHGGYLSQFHDGCLALWTPEEFEKQMIAMRDASETGRSNRNLARVWASGSADVQVDGQGRLVIPAHLREFAQLRNDVLVHGAIDRIELWDPTAWGAKIGPVEQLLVDGDEGAE